MPLYEYECKACGHQFEELSSMEDDTAVQCPCCCKKEAQRLLSATKQYQPFTPKSPYSTPGGLPKPTGGGCPGKGGFS